MFSNTYMWRNYMVHLHLLDKYAVYVTMKHEAYKNADNTFLICLN